MKHPLEFLALWLLANIIAAGLWSLLCIRRDQRTRNPEPYGFRRGGEVEIIKHGEEVRHDRA